MKKIKKSVICTIASIVCVCGLSVTTYAAQSPIEQVKIVGTPSDLFDKSQVSEDLFYDGNYKNKALTASDADVLIYESADEGSSVLGKMTAPCIANVIKRGMGWTKIESGTIKGYVHNEEIVTNQDAEKAAESIEGTLNVAMTPEEEIQAAERESREAQENETEIVDENGTPIEVQDAFGASDDETYLLACQVYVEAGGESYDGMLAVANVILNRVRSASFPNSITEVIYQDGQFPPASNGVLDNVMAQGPSDAAMSAALDALNGNNNIGDMLYFNMAGSTPGAPYEVTIGNQTFYTY